MFGMKTTLITLLATPALVAATASTAAAAEAPAGPAAQVASGSYIEDHTYCAPGQHVYIETFGKGTMMAKWSTDPHWNGQIQSVIFYNSPVLSASRIDTNLQGGIWAILGNPGEVNWAHGSCG